MADLVPISVREVERRRDDIVSRALQIQIDQPVDIERLVNSVLSVLPAGVAYDTVFESVRNMAGNPLGRLDAIRLAWRLAGNVKALKEGRPVPPWTAQREDEWVPLQIMRVHKTRNAKDVIGYEVTTRVMAGSPCPLKLSSFWSIRVAKYVSSQIGFSKPWHKYPYSEPVDMVGLRMYGLIEAARSRGKPEFHEIQCSDSLKQWNRDNVLKGRLRVGIKCPNEYQHACRVCAIGYDRCQYATHPKTFTVGFCNGCGTENATFDPDDPSPHCADCAVKARLKRRT